MCIVFLGIYWLLFLFGAIESSWTFMIVGSIVWIIISPFVEAFVHVLIPDNREG